MEEPDRTSGASTKPARLRRDLAALVRAAEFEHLPDTQPAPDQRTGRATSSHGLHVSAAGGRTVES